MSNTIKRNLFKKSGNFLIWEGVKMVKRAFNLKPKTTTSAYLKALVSGQTGGASVYCADRTYYYVNIDTVKEILKYDLTDEKEYEAEKYDCDDFAATIYAIFRFVFELNTMAMARRIRITDPKTGKTIGWHRASLFVAEKPNGNLGVFYLEPQTDNIVELTGKGEVDLFGKRYILTEIDF